MRLTLEKGLLLAALGFRAMPANGLLVAAGTAGAALGVGSATMALPGRRAFTILRFFSVSALALANSPVGSCSPCRALRKHNQVWSSAL